MNLLKCLLIKNDCYTTGKKITPKGVMVHSTGANNPTLARYVNPVKGQEGYDELLSTIGKNIYNNHWNTPRPGGQGVCVHGFIGKLADGSIGTVQTLPWDMRGWHAGGAANNTHISFEICEDALRDSAYFEKVYREAAELTAYLCDLYGLDPLADGVVICHKEGARRGWASNHGDVEHWFPKFGKTMDDFRRDVKNLLDARKDEDKDKDEEGEKEMRFNTVEDVEKGASYALPTIKKMIAKGFIAGGGAPKDKGGNPTDMNLSLDMLRILVIVDRAGGFGD